MSAQIAWEQSYIVRSPLSLHVLATAGPVDHARKTLIERIRTVEVLRFEGSSRLKTLRFDRFRNRNRWDGLHSEGKRDDEYRDPCREQAPLGANRYSGPTKGICCCV